MTRGARTTRKRPARLAPATEPIPFRSSGQVEEWSPELLKSRAYELILLDIILGVLAPGARLDEHGLAERYGIGVAGVRDALGRLSLEGMVQRRARIGTIVAPLDLLEVEQAFEARYLIEPHCAMLAAQKAGSGDLRAISSAFDGAEKAVKARDFRRLVAMDQNFHCAVAVASQNLTLARIVISLHHKAARYWCYSMATRSERSRLEDVAQHRAVANAIAAREPKLAHAAMLRVLGESPDTVRSSVSAALRTNRGVGE